MEEHFGPLRDKSSGTILHLMPLGVFYPKEQVVENVGVQFPTWLLNYCYNEAA